MLSRRLIPNLLKPPQTNQFSSVSESVEKEKGTRIGRKLVQTLLLSITGGVALSALDDLAIYQSCSGKAMEKALKSQAIVDALGEPIVKGSWYNASLALVHKRHSASCSFPVSGPKGTGIFKLKAVRNEEGTWIPFLRPRDWEILMMDAQLHVPTNEENHQTFRVNLSDSSTTATASACTECNISKPQESAECNTSKSQEPAIPEKR